MGKILVSINANYDKLSKNEKRIADFLLTEDRSLNSMTITELSEKVQTSGASIVRFVKKFGFEGYREFKIYLAKEEYHLVGKSISEDDDLQNVYSKVCDDVYSTLIKTKNVLSNDLLCKAYNCLIEAEEIFIYGVGNSFCVAQDAYHKFQRLGLHAQAIGDSHFQIISAAKATEKTIVVAISHSGTTKDIIEAVQLAKQYGARVVAFTSEPKSPLAKMADISLITISDEVNYRVLGLSSRFAQLAIIDALYSYAIMHKPGTIETIQKIESAVIQKRVTPKTRAKKQPV